MAAAVWSQLAADAGNLALVQRGEEVAPRGDASRPDSPMEQEDGSKLWRKVLVTGLAPAADRRAQTRWPCG